MAKKKGFWLGLSMLMLCIGVMTFGVYSAISASLNIAGTLGFNMHNCVVAVNGTIFNVAQMDSSGQYSSSVDRELVSTIMGGEETTTASLNIGDLSFYYGAYTDPDTGTTTSKLYDMVFELTFSNISESGISATFPAPTVGGGVTLITDTASGYTSLPVSNATIAQNEQYTIKFALRLNDSSQVLEKVDFSWQGITFEEVVPDSFTDTKQGLIYTLNADRTGWSVKGDYFINGADMLVNNNTANEIVIPDKKYNIPVIELANYAFGSSYANEGCVNITSISLPRTLTRIGEQALYGCSGLTSITIPSSVTSIGYKAFDDCESLTSLTIPSSVTTFSSGAFGFCLSSIKFMSTTPPTLHASFFAGPWTTKIYVPSASLSKYKAASGFSARASYIVGY